MKNYAAYWKERIAKSEEFNYDSFCRDEDPGEFSVYAFSTETNNNGPCFFSAGVWLWAADINELASWIIEFQLRLIFATCDEGKNIKDTLDMAGVEYLRHIADKNKGNRGESTRCRVLTLAEELQGYIDAGSLTFDVFADWVKRYSKLSEDMPVIVEFELFNGLDGAIELLREHEHDQYENRENLDLLERFQIDCTC